MLKSLLLTVISQSGSTSWEKENSTMSAVKRCALTLKVSIKPLGSEVSFSPANHGFAPVILKVGAQLEDNPQPPVTILLVERAGIE